ncbi:regulatory protein TetR [Gemmatirosa kalamazoonensis]|uniref:Regulatory protein TetR n=1 Tax=Gemmatirosa kalamazoonensis TaxID=861299 RepID=W0RH74_9BACT|nr:TetR/AcrR family transcriptional regulator [Gemmatirosa kalamazoonensis]AHG88738.1 regulatory protein TetR [Gemmatirosa kalamazoonensis]
MTPVPRQRPARPPLQERGQRRVDAILDAAATIVAERGVAGLTVHGVARRARTAIGSMYHFFPDLEAVLGALADRHARTLRGELEALSAAPVDWAALPLDVAVDGFLDPLLTYIERHPDVLHVLRRPGRGARRHPELEALLLQTAERIVRARTPEASPAARAARAATMLAVVDGVLTRTERVASPPASTMMRELKRAIVGYLGSYEAI